MTTAHMHEIIISEYLPCICCTHVPEIHVCPEMLCIFCYNDVVHVRDVTTARTWVTHCLPWRLLRQVSKCTDTWYRLSLLRQRSCSGPATCHHAMTNAPTVVLFCVDIGMTLRATTMPVCKMLDVEPMWRHHWHCWLIAYAKAIVTI